MSTTITTPTPPLFDEARLAVAGFLARYSGPTRKSYVSDLRQFFAWCASVDLEIFGVKRGHLELWARAMEERGLARATIGRRLSTVAGFYRICVLDGLIEHSPAEYVRRPKIDTESATLGLDRMELSAFVAQGAAGGPMDHALACLLGLLGLRVSEAFSINIDDLSLERGHRTVTVLGKGSKLAVIPLPPRVARAVDLAADERVSGPLLLTQAGSRLNRHAATRIVNRLAKAAGITKHISPHSLRHSFITAALDAGVPLRDVQIAARHSDPRTTTRYDRARDNLDRHANYIVTAFVAGGSWGLLRDRRARSLCPQRRWDRALNHWPAVVTRLTVDGTRLSANTGCLLASWPVPDPHAQAVILTGRRGCPRRRPGPGIVCAAITACAHIVAATQASASTRTRISPNASGAPRDQVRSVFTMSRLQEH